MSTRMLAAFVVASLALVAGCSSSGGGDSDGGGKSFASSSRSTGTGPSPTATQPRYDTYADFPGKDFVTTEPVLRLGIRVKPVDTTWTPELGGKSADPGKHFVAVYVAVTGELADRGVEGVKLGYLRLKFTSPEMKCNFGHSDNCYQEAYPSGEVAALDDVQEDVGGKWRDYTWTESFLGTDLQRGETGLGVVGFSVPNTEKGKSFELCGPTKEAEVDTDQFACVPLKAPEPTA
jgi:hypothetical protein